MSRVLDLDCLLEVPVTSGLALSPSGDRLVTTVQHLGPDGRSTSSLWEVTTDGSSEPRRLTWSAEGEAAPCFLADGSLVFLSGRPDPSRPGTSGTGLWRLPAGSGEARCLLVVPGGITAVATASAAPVLALRAMLHPAAKDLDEDAAWQQERERSGTSGLLLESLPFGWWDTFYAPRSPRVLVLDVLPDGSAVVRSTSAPGGTELYDVYGGALSLTPDGSAVVSNRRRSLGQAMSDYELVVHDATSLRSLASGHHLFMPVVSPDGRRTVAIRRDLGVPATPLETWTLVLHDLADGAERELTPDLELWPVFPVWAPDGSAVFAIADRCGKSVVLRIDVADGATTVLTSGSSSSALVSAPDGSCLYTISSTLSDPERIVRLPLDGAAPQVLATLRPELEVPGRVERVSATAADGGTVHSWLVVPEQATAEQPAPVVVWLHGGPSLSWNGTWTWRSNPQLLAAAGYAVLLPDPGQSTGYGRQWALRGRGAWGEQSYTDVLAALDGLAGRAELDLERTAAMGASFGGWLVNWIAGHTDRFSALVSVSGMWAMDQQHGTSDSWTWAEHEFGSPYDDLGPYTANSPHLHVKSIRTPVLVVHGGRDLRVPKDHALRMFTDLQRHDVPSRLLLFPDEAHTISRPANLRVFYETVLAFFGEHLHGRGWHAPTVL